MKVFRVNNIEWQTDGQKVDLPIEAVVECEDEEEIADTLSDIYGWLVNNFDIRSVEER